MPRLDAGPPTDISRSFHISLHANLSGVRHYAGREDFNNPICLRRAASIVNGCTLNATHPVYTTLDEDRAGGPRLGLSPVGSLFPS